MSAPFSKGELIVDASANIREYYILSLIHKFSGAYVVSIYCNTIMRRIRDTSFRGNKNTALAGRDFRTPAVLTIFPYSGYDLIETSSSTEHYGNIRSDKYCKGFSRVSKLKMQRKRYISIRVVKQWAGDCRLGIIRNPRSLRSSKLISHYVKLFPDRGPLQLADIRRRRLSRLLLRKWQLPSNSNFLRTSRIRPKSSVYHARSSSVTPLVKANEQAHAADSTSIAGRGRGTEGASGRKLDVVFRPSLCGLLKVA